mmetsp:Transcript_127588/g.355114  ORF Transcript_127588/g.355114 Transcript_127588/m.355114 type:complete len:270 (-) Transcript_127588:49-858(-)|eukprot:CAMPEP_0179201340 /NCGR_PEP_ID=MMETSP0796-20121207/100204_1 /TAXON_ID=73915 /ORGANISM="Pyrodinium bahamense, Strain pbaha01" /LENGTH=269 /DNA_ID=CAMNT_0020905897 /DNA_START=69 /DNA_END=878 /DNA_ORIENTATION=-
MAKRGREENTEEPENDREPEAAATRAVADVIVTCHVIDGFVKLTNVNGEEVLNKQVPSGEDSLGPWLWSEAQSLLKKPGGRLRLVTPNGEVVWEEVLDEEGFKTAVLKVAAETDQEELPKFDHIYGIDDKRAEDDEFDEKMGLGGDPTLDVYKMKRPSLDVIQCLGVAYGSYKKYGSHYPSPEENLAQVAAKEVDSFGLRWGRSSMVSDLLKYFADEYEGDLEEEYLPLIGIDEEIEARFVCAAWGNGCQLCVLLLGKEHVFKLSYTNG